MDIPLLHFMPPIGPILVMLIVGHMIRLTISEAIRDSRR